MLSQGHSPSPAASTLPAGAMVNGCRPGRTGQFFFFPGPRLPAAGYPAAGAGRPGLSFLFFIYFLPVSSFSCDFLDFRHFFLKNHQKLIYFDDFSWKIIKNWYILIYFHLFSLIFTYFHYISLYFIIFSLYFIIFHYIFTIFQYIYYILNIFNIF